MLFRSVKFVPTTTQNRFTALQAGEVDVLSRTTTWTLGREGNLEVVTLVNEAEAVGL